MSKISPAAAVLDETYPRNGEPRGLEAKLRRTAAGWVVE